MRIAVLCLLASLTNAPLCAQAPTAHVYGGGVFCPGTSVSVHATLTAGGSGPYQWSFQWSDGIWETVSSPTQPHTHTRQANPGASILYQITSLVDWNGVLGTSTGGAFFQLDTPQPVSISSVQYFPSCCLRVDGSGFVSRGLARATIYWGQTPLPTSVESDTICRATPPALGSLWPVGGGPVYVVTESISPCWTSVSNTLPAVWDPSFTNRGTVINLTTGGGGAASTLTFRVEGAEPNRPVAIWADFGFPVGSFLPPHTFPFLGHQSAVTISSNAYSMASGSLDPAGKFEVTMGAPAAASGLAFRLQGLFLDPNQPAGISLTWPLEAFIP